MTQSNTPSQPRSIGFPRSSAGTAVAAQPVLDAVSVTAGSSTVPAGARAIPKPTNRGKGRLFVALVMGSLFAFLGHLVWSEYVKYQAYGEVRGRVLDLSPLTDGTLMQSFVEEGDHVQAGQLLSRLDDYELRRERIRLRKEIQLAYANLNVRLAETQNLKRNALSDQTDKQVEYFRLLGEYHSTKSRVEELKRVYETNRNLYADSVIAESELLASKSAIEVQQSMLSDMRSAIATLKSSLTQLSKDSFSELVEAEMSRIEPIEQGLKEIEEISRASEIRAPVSGKILRRVKREGEFVRKSDVVFRLLQKGSTEAVVFLPQQRGQLLKPGDRIRLFVKTLDQTHDFRVQRVASSLVPPPNSIRSNYRANQVVIEVHSKPVDPGFSDTLGCWIGSQVALPRFDESTFGNWIPTALVTDLMERF